MMIQYRLHEQGCTPDFIKQTAVFKRILKLIGHINVMAKVEERRNDTHNSIKHYREN